MGCVGVYLSSLPSVQLPTGDFGASPRQGGKNDTWAAAGRTAVMG